LTPERKIDSCKIILSREIPTVKKKTPQAEPLHPHFTFHIYLLFFLSKQNSHQSVEKKKIESMKKNKNSHLLSC